MENQSRDPKKKAFSAAPTQVVESQLESVGEVVVEHHAAPPAGPADLTIHKRQRLPSVPIAPALPTKENK